MSVGIGRILTHLRDFGPTSRANLARETGLSSAGVTKICASLDEAGLLRESASKETALGRPATEVSIHPQGGYVLAIHLSPVRAHVAVCNLAMQVLSEDTVDYGASASETDVVERAVAVARGVVTAARIPFDQLLGVGVGVPGSVDEEGRINTHSVLAGWRNVPFAKMFEAALGLPAILSHNATAIAIAEARYGAWKGSESLLYLLLGKGIGGGYVKTGAHERTSIVEIGHVVVDPNGPLCRCSGTGCLERYFSEAPLRQMVGRDDIPSSQLISTAMQVEGWSEIYEYFVQALATTVTLLGPETIVLGGDFLTAPDHFVAELRKDLPPRVMPQQRANLAIERASLATPSGVQGAACIALDTFFFSSGPAHLGRSSNHANRA
ncbi:ROK family transcriptional regulator [Nitratireductor sp. CH_MIT9313-5]|uniref:ROK family transcriptional regulator n=1 Tax=Nitratireductor sp. CH_MIT9313-5 TaxID=3107764 RepID=UPI003008C587